MSAGETERLEEALTGLEKQCDGYVRAAREKSVVKVTIAMKRGQWKLTVIGTRAGKTEPELFYSARCESVGAALDQFEDWRRGVIIV